MADVQHRVEEHITIADHATKHLSAIQKSLTKTTELFNKASEAVGMMGGLLGGIGAAFGFEEVIRGSMEFVRTIDRVSQITGETTERTHGLVSLMNQYGVHGEEAERILTRMSKKGAMLEMSMQGATGHAGALVNVYRQMGIDISKGPEHALEQMSRQVQKGKMGVGQVAMMLGVAPRQALDLMRVLERGPAAMKAAIDKVSKSNIAVHASTVQQMRRIEESKNKIAEGWEHIKVAIGTRLFPVIEKLMGHVSDNLDHWVDKAAEFGEVLGRVLEKHGKLILNIGKVLLLNYGLMKATGMGMTGWAGRAIGKGSQMAMGGAFAYGQAGGGVAGIVAAVGPVLAVVGAVALVLAAAYATFVAFRDDVGGVRTELLATWDKIMVQVDSILSGFGGLDAVWERVKRIFGPDGGIGRFFITLIPKALILYLKYTEGFIRVIRTIGIAFPQFWELFKLGAKQALETFGHVAFDVFMNLGIFFLRVIDNVTAAVAKIPGMGGLKTNLAGPMEKYLQDEQKKRTATKPFLSEAFGTFSDTFRVLGRIAEEEAKHRSTERTLSRKTPDGRSGPPTFDFRGSRFNIEQKFAEGFDPDRMAVAFTNDLAALGERRLQSGFAPIYGVR